MPSGLVFSRFHRDRRVIGWASFADANGVGPTQAAETRLVAAIEASHGFDVRLVLLTLHAGLSHPSLIERYAFSVE